MPPRKSSRAKKKVEEVVEQPVEQEVEEVAPPVEETVEVQSKGKGKADVAMEDAEQTTADAQDGAKDAEQTAKGVKLTPEERLAKLKELRTRMVRPSLAAPHPNLIPVLCRTNPPSTTARP
jgi:hypothetical protein